MSVEINIPPFFQHLTDNKKTAEVGGSTVGEALEELADMFPELRDKLFSRPGLLMKGLNVFVNGASAYPEELAKPVHDGDKIHITYVMVGG
jgi:molybdopterin converting factor small subunit